MRDADKKQRVVPSLYMHNELRGLITKDAYIVRAHASRNEAKKTRKRINRTRTFEWSQYTEQHKQPASGLEMRRQTRCPDGICGSMGCIAMTPQRTSSGVRFGCRIYEFQSGVSIVLFG